MKTWEHTYSSYLDLVIKLQKRVLRIMSFSGYKEHTKRHSRNLKLCHSSLIGTSEQQAQFMPYFRTITPFEVPFSSRLLHTRGHNRNINVPPISNLYSRRRLAYIKTKIWNNLLKTIKESPRFWYVLKQAVIHNEYLSIV